MLNLELISLIIAFIGCCYQIINVTIEYFNFDVNYEITYKTRVKIKLPDISLEIDFESIQELRKNESISDLEYIMLLLKLTIVPW